MSSRQIGRHSWMAALAALLLASCGGGGGAQLAGIDRLGVSSGTVTGFGSVFVNGVEWRTGGASISLDGAPGTESDLRVGQVVVVRGSLDADGAGGNASRIDFSSSLVGPISAGSIDTAAGSFDVLGRTVLVSADTQYDVAIPDRVADGQRRLGDLQAGDVVAVSGYFDASGAVRATRIGLASGAGSYQVKGVISDLDPGLRTFSIGTLAVDCSGAGSPTLANGDFVEVKGTYAGGVLVASRCEKEDGLPGGESGDAGEVEGYVSGLAKPGPGLATFAIGTVSVSVDGGTRFEGGSYAALANNLKVEVEGDLDATGVLVARKLEFRVQPADASIELEGDVDRVDATAGTLRLKGMDVLVSVNAVTRYEDESDAGLEKFSLASLTPGDHVEIRGAEIAGPPAGDLLATRLERRDPRDLVTLRGPVQAVSEPDLTILGVTVATDVAVFRDAAHNEIGEAAFFAAVQAGTAVKARAPATGINGNVLAATVVELSEGEDD